MATLEITSLQVDTTIGVYDWEQKIKQRLLIDLWLTVDIQHASQTDQLTDTIDYDTLCKELTTIISERPCNLIETVAHLIAEYLRTRWALDNFKIRVSKPGALPNAENVCIIYP